MLSHTCIVSHAARSVFWQQLKYFADSVGDACTDHRLIHLLLHIACSLAKPEHKAGFGIDEGNDQCGPGYIRYLLAGNSNIDAVVAISEENQIKSIA